MPENNNLAAARKTGRTLGQGRVKIRRMVGGDAPTRIQADRFAGRTEGARIEGPTKQAERFDYRAAPERPPARAPSAKQIAMWRLR